MSVRYWLIALVTFLPFMNSPGLTAESLHYNIYPATFTNQLSQPTVTSIHTDRKGFLWVGTQSGLNKYDGSNVTVYDSSDPNKNWVPASYIHQISEDSAGHLWIATHGGGLAVYNENTDSFEVPRGKIDDSYLFIKSLYISQAGDVWFGTRDKGVGMYDPVLGRFSVWLQRNKETTSIQQASDFLEDPTGKIWASGKRGLYQIDSKRYAVSSYELPNDDTATSEKRSVVAIERGPLNTIWVGTSDGKLLQFNVASAAYKKIDTLTKHELGWITDLAYVDDKLWVAADSGIIVIDSNTGESQSFTQSNSLLSSNFTICLHSDQRSIYVGSARGLDIISASVFEKFHSANSQLFDDVSSFSESESNRIWVGTYDGAYYLDEDTRSHKALSTLYDKILLNDKRITTLDVNHNKLWLGFFHGGVQVIDLENGVSKDAKLPNNHELAITKLLHTEDGSTWIGTFNQGLFQEKYGSISSYYIPTNKAKHIPESSILFIIKIGNAEILAGSDREIYSINYLTESVQALGPLLDLNKRQAVFSAMARNINGDIWIGVRDSGLYIWHYSENPITPDSIQPIAGNSEFPSSTVYAIEFDSSGNAWVSTSQGIYKLDQNGLLVDNYSLADGLQGNDFNGSSSFKDSKGRIYFGGSNGYNRFDPSRTIKPPPPPPVVLTKLNIAGNTPQLPVAIHALEAIELSYLDYFITLEFSALDYIDPENNQFRYKLENFDPRWIESGKRNSATYTNLPSGSYTFRVQGANSAGIWNREGASILVVVHPAPWRTWQAYLFYAILALFLIYLATNYYENIVLRKKALVMAKKMHDAADKATDDLQEQLEFQDDFVKVAHSHSVNTLSLISEFMSEQAEYIDDELASEGIANTSDRVAALALLEQCLFYQGDELFANLKDYTNVIISKLLEETPSIAESITTINEVPPKLLPAELASPLAIVIFELLKNCFQHAFENSSSANYIHIRMEEVSNSKTNNQARSKLIIEDNGVGMPVELTRDRVETPGLAIVGSMAKKLDGNLQITSNKGTRVSLEYPEGT